MGCTVNFLRQRRLSFTGKLSFCYFRFHYKINYLYGRLQNRCIFVHRRREGFALRPWSSPSAAPTR